MRVLFFMSIALMLTQLQLDAQALRRKASLGIAPAQVSENLRKQHQLNEGEAIFVRRLFPNNTYAQAGGQEGDLILKINGKQISAKHPLRAVLTTLDLRESDPVEFSIIRQSKKLNLKTRAVGRALEAAKTGKVHYKDFKYKEGRIRLILNEPEGKGPHPTIFFIPGYNCMSIDNMPAFHPYRQLLDSLSALGYVIVRMEKPGMGDNENTGNCFNLGFDNDLEAYWAGYQQMQDYKFIDTSKVFIWGHSMGGIIAPLLGAKANPKGIIVYGTTHKRWIEYLIEMVRFQNPRLGNDYAETEKDLEVLYELLYEHYYLNKSSKELAAANEDYKRILERDFQFDGESQILFRHEKFWQEINKHNLTKAWMDANCRVLSIWGEADLQALNDQSHKEIAAIINSVHEDWGTYKLMEKTNHSMIKVGSMEEGIAADESGKTREIMMQEGMNYKVVDLTDEWIQNILKQTN